MMSERIIIDTDLNYPSDDFQALALLIASRKFDIQGVSAAAGNTFAAEVYFNLKEALHTLGHNSIPVVAGHEVEPSEQDRTAIERQIADSKISFTGSYGKATKPRLTEEFLSRYRKEQTVTLAHLLTRSRHPATLVCLGPLTNIAHVLEHSPNLMSKVSKIIALGGALNQNQNKLEFNFWYNPHAAKMVMESGIPTVLIPWEVTRSCRANSYLTGSVLSGTNRTWKLFAHDYVGMLEQHGSYMPLCDQLLALILINPDIVSSTLTGRFDVDTDSTSSYGLTRFIHDLDSHLTVISDVHSSLAHETLIETLSLSPYTEKETVATLPRPIEQIFLNSGVYNEPRRTI